MKIGYPCINNSIGCTANSTFRLASYSEEKLIEKVSENLKCLMEILRWNKKKGIYFFRIGSQLVPFASHPICKFNWQKYFKKEFKEVGGFIKKNKMRISMHPDQFVVLNSNRKEVLENSLRELEYHADVLDLFGLDSSAKMQIHVGAAYGDKENAKKVFIQRYKKLNKKIRKRLVIENDDRIFSVKDCLEISEATGISILVDSFHHELNNNGESIRTAIKLCEKTWDEWDGKIMIDYSSQKKDGRRGSHTENIDIRKFKKFLEESKGIKMDIMLEIKNKEKSVLEALKILENVR